MGNGASVEPGGDDLGAQVTATRKKKNKKKGGGSDDDASSYLVQEEPVTLDEGEGNVYGVDTTGQRFQGNSTKSNNNSVAKTSKTGGSPTRNMISNKSKGGYNNSDNFDDLVDNQVDDEYEV